MRIEGFNTSWGGKSEGEMTQKTSVRESNKPTEEEIDELEYRLKYGQRKTDKPLI